MLRLLVRVAAAWFLVCQFAVVISLPSLLPSPPIYVTSHHLKNKKIEDLRLLRDRGWGHLGGMGMTPLESMTPLCAVRDPQVENCRNHLTALDP